jgi:DNA-binding GntR family transcriptional regulator
MSLEIHEKVLASHREPIEIARALRPRDADAAERLVRKHFDRAAAMLLDSLVSA